ncbi:FliH/SctL family protein [Microbacterium sp. LjRoot45]|uniref:FliH/SctL family protein n=1 Tax=Microbacterium sp. LjRoot45 TaxID=3342329 RepID=UPI003ECDCC36
MSPEPAAPIPFVRREIPRLTPAGSDRERERARTQGHALGYAEGLRIAAAEAAEAAERADAERRSARETDAAAAAEARAGLEKAAASLRDRLDMIAGLAEEKIWTLALDVAEAILARELSHPVHAARVAVSRAERAVGESADAVVVLSADDLATLERLGEVPEGVAIESSPALASGDAVVRVSDGDIDLRVAEALARARAALAEETT